MPWRPKPQRTPQPKPPGHRAAHRTARAELAPLVASGYATCSRCAQPIDPAAPWDADRRPWGWAPSHAACNRSAGGRHEP